LFPLACSSRDRFLPTNKVVKLLFPPTRFGGGYVSPNFYSFGIGLFCFYLFIYFFLLFWQIDRLELF
jgi:hypothetical protein